VPPEVAETSTAMGPPPQRTSNLGLWMIGATLVVLILFFVGLAVTKAVTSHGTGDPKGRVLRQLQTIRGAVPSGSTNVAETPQEPDWIGSCDEPDYQAGWDSVNETIQFGSKHPYRIVIGHIAEWMQDHGWMSLVSGTYPQWTKSGPSGTMSAALDAPQGTETFYSLSADAPPVGSVGHCWGG
jgi:hypothetical protein